MLNEKKKIEKLCHDLRGHLTVLMLNLELLKLSPEYQIEDSSLIKLGSAIEKEIDKMKKTIAEAEDKFHG